MPICAKISADILYDCDNPMVAGAADNLYLINSDDWDDATVTENGTNSQLITNIVLASGILAYKYEGKNYSVEPTQKLVKQKYAEVYDHEVTFKVFKADAATKLQLEKMASGSVVAIVENVHRGADGESAFEVYGRSAGLEVQDLERMLNDADTQGAFNLVLRSSEVAKEPHLPATLYTTDYATTKAIVEGLAA